MKHYTQLTHDALKRLNLELVREPVLKRTESSEYYNIECAFDIESTSIKINGEKQAFMYIWMFGIGVDGDVYYGRTWADFKCFLDVLESGLELGPLRRLAVYVHNLAYEFQFIKDLFKWSSVFSIGTRTPIRALFEGGIEFRDSYMLSGQSLQDVAKNLVSFPGLNKRVGDLDYSLIRHHNTPLTDTEMGYCKLDINIVTAYIREQIDIYGNVIRIPMTNTGRVRRYVRDECYYTNPGNHRKSSRGRYESYRELMVGVEPKKGASDGDFNPGLQLTLGDYKQLKRAFSGGYVHANSIHRGKVLEKATSFDETSAYPAVMLTEQFPMSAARKVQISSPDDIETLMETYLVMFDMRLTGVRTSVQQEQYLSASKCWELSGELLSNGRVYSADVLATTVTDVDYNIIKRAYTYDTIDITNVRVFKRGYLPRAILRSILHLYQTKTALKGVAGKEKEYLLAKGMLNSIFGMTVTDVIRERNIYTDDWTQEVEEPSRQISDYNKSHSRFLYYPWGVWVTAYARQNLWSAILEMGDDYVYSDTDSVKFLNAKKYIPYINNYNKLMIKKLTIMNETFQFDQDLLSPKTKDGVTKLIGVWEYEGTYDKFKTLGAKRYLTLKNGVFNLTLAGLSKEKGLCYLIDRANGVEDVVFDLFDNELYVPAEHTGKLLHTYIDTPATFVVSDYLGTNAEVHSPSGVHLEGTDFTLSIDREVGNVLEMLFNDGYLKEGSFYDGSN